MNNCIVCKSETKNKLFCSRNCYNIKRPNMVKHNEITKMCVCCKTKFETNRKTAKYCSDNCYRLTRVNTNIKCVCSNCNKEFSVRKSRFEKGEVKYCSLQCRNTSEEWITSNVLKNYNQLHKIGLNKLELRGSELLRKLNVNFIEQKLINETYVVDVFLPDSNLIIQWDGDYWHGHPKNLKEGVGNKLQRSNMEKDIRVNTALTDMGYNLLRFWQDDVDNNTEYVIDTIRQNL
jgi:very-short-patch-repair endonuclease